ncbi:hypothetical protein L226DRAFT_375129 [Lentinus tigrinus ALCF2SS1-7]|uniref:Uncharacterized protein n=1 Tax=Lentinus tigrinus ALCF2SS1-6 TaxID=1328759 RepID=A0A5C2SKC5_9APHY|nr:hypothetical protein L227DRAFT_320676 [Lentinus tigrinus ALCF2SS1-6]RPD76391.1 hypothetical protein L226DRAFT_375129 [Lentinus tigrinus ALCF2SS1-7]
MTDMTIPFPTTPSTLDTAELRDFFDRLAAGDYDGLAKELDIYPGSLSRPSTTFNAPNHLFVDEESHQDPDASIRSIDSMQSFKFQPTAEGLHRAVSLLRGDDKHRGSPTPEEEEAYQFTFRLMIHKLYSIKDFARMVDDVVRTSQERYQPLSPELTGRRRSSVSFSFDSYSFEGDSFASMLSPTSPSEASSFPPSSPSSSWMHDRLHSPQFEPTDEGDARAVKKRIVGRKLSVVDGSADEENAGSPAWVYDAAVASVDSPVSYFDLPMSAGSPSRIGNSSSSEEGDYASRKRRYSFLAARGL